MIAIPSGRRSQDADSEADRQGSAPKTARVVVDNGAKSHEACLTRRPAGSLAISIGIIPDSIAGDCFCSPISLPDPIPRFDSPFRSRRLTSAPQK